MSEKIEKPDSNEDILRRDLKTVFDGVEFLTPMEQGFLHELAKAISERRKEELESLAIQNSTASKVHTSNLNTHLRNAQYNGPGFYAALKSFANAHGFSIFPESGMAVEPHKVLPFEYIKRSVQTKEGLVDFYIYVNYPDKRIYVYNFGMGFYIGAPIEYLMK